MPNMVPVESDLATRLPAEGVTLGVLHIAVQEWKYARRGVVIAVTLGTHTGAVWLLEDDWQAWCEALLGTSDSAAIDPLLLKGVAQWGLSPLLAASGAEVVPGSVFSACSCVPEQMALTFSWYIEHHVFHALLFDWPGSYFKTLTGQILPAVRRIHTLPPLVFTLYAGECRLSLAQLQQLQTGAGIRMQTFGALRDGVFALPLVTGAVARVTFNTEEHMQINELVQDIESLLVEERDDSPPLSSLSIDTLPQKVLVEVGQVEMALGVLRTLSEGDMLPVDVRFSSEVTLRLNGRVIGHGDLVGCGDSFLVRISRWYLSPSADT